MDLLIQTLTLLEYCCRTRDKLVDGSILVWGGSFNRSSLSFITKQVLNSSSSKALFSLVRGRYTIAGGSPAKVEFNYAGSILSALNSEVLTPEIIELKEKVSNVHSLELLSPHLMRGSLREAALKIKPTDSQSISAVLTARRAK
ncbi:hypothetical protein [Pseudomonas sp. Irchel s3f10]|uniref:hypothetical protein n=1 Tax=Pseudomonas sp. Irchel s3f10 TaxID=2009137 RepID=UPI0011401A92|nr:hypothetical protein [Pseudomonas sp. Irchel s3f10]